MTAEEKEPFKEMAKAAKEKDKFNETNKFTVTGER